MKWSAITWTLFLFLSCLFRSAYRLSEAEGRSGAGALPGRYLPLRHHLSGLPHAHAARQARWGLRLCETAPSRHLPQPGLHGAAAAVWDRRSVSGMRSQAQSDWACLIDSLAPGRHCGGLRAFIRTHVLFVRVKLVQFRSVYFALVLLAWHIWWMSYFQEKLTNGIPLQYKLHCAHHIMNNYDSEPASQSSYEVIPLTFSTGGESCQLVWFLCVFVF